jgi:hypothetical protein
VIILFLWPLILIFFLLLFAEQLSNKRKADHESSDDQMPIKRAKLEENSMSFFVLIAVHSLARHRFIASVFSFLQLLTTSSNILSML